jgi:hypothetical protein
VPPEIAQDQHTHRISITLSERQARVLARGSVSRALRRQLWDLITFTLPRLKRRRHPKGARP